MTQAILDELLGELNQNGYTVIRNAFSNQDAKSVIDSYSYWCKRNASLVNRFKKTNGRNSRLVNFHIVSEEMRSLFLNQLLLDVCDSFFSGLETSIYTSLFFQEGTSQKLHRDAPLFCTCPENLFLGCWFALEGADESNGALVGVRNSHYLFSDELLTRYRIGRKLMGFLRKKMKFVDNTAWEEYQEYVRTQCALASLSQHVISVNPGDIVIWHPLFVHGGLEGSFSSTRYSAVMHVAPKGIQVHGSYAFFQPFLPAKFKKLNYKPVSEERSYLEGTVNFTQD